jgi:hypothetical protein
MGNEVCVTDHHHHPLSQWMMTTKLTLQLLSSSPFSSLLLPPPLPLPPPSDQQLMRRTTGPGVTGWIMTVSLVVMAFFAIQRDYTSNDAIHCHEGLFYCIVFGFFIGFFWGTCFFYVIRVCSTVHAYFSYSASCKQGFCQRSASISSQDIVFDTLLTCFKSSYRILLQ